MGLFGVPTPNFVSDFDHPYLEIKLSSQLRNATVTEVNVNRPKLIREVHFALLAYISVVGIPGSVQKVNTAKCYEIFCSFKGKRNCLGLFKERGSSNFFNVIQKETAPWSHYGFHFRLYLFVAFNFLLYCFRRHLTILPLSCHGRHFSNQIQYRSNPLTTMHVLQCCSSGICCVLLRTVTFWLLQQWG